MKSMQRWLPTVIMKISTNPNKYLAPWVKSPMPYKPTDGAARAESCSHELCRVVTEVDHRSKCLAFGDRIIKLNDYLLEQASQKYDAGRQKYGMRKGKSSFSHQTSDLSQPSSIKHHPSLITSSIILQTSAFVQSTIATLMTCIVLNIWCWKMDKNDNGEIYNIRYTIWEIWWRRMIQFWQLTSKR